MSQPDAPPAGLFTSQPGDTSINRAIAIVLVFILNVLCR